MEKGELSNKMAPAIVIDIDELIIEIPEDKSITDRVNMVANKLGETLSIERLSRMEVNSYRVKRGVYDILESLFYQDIMIYLFAHRPDSYRDGLERLLSDLPYTRLYVGDKRDREEILGRRHIKYYYYKVPEHSSTDNKKKEVKVGGQYGIVIG